MAVLTFDKPPTGNCLRRFEKMSPIQRRGPHIGSTIRAKCFCAPLANYFRTLAMSKRAFTASADAQMNTPKGIFYNYLQE